MPTHNPNIETVNTLTTDHFDYRVGFVAGAQHQVLLKMDKDMGAISNIRAHVRHHHNTYMYVPGFKSACTRPTPCKNAKAEAVSLTNLAASASE